MAEKEHSGKKYHRGVTGVDGRVAVIDIYSFLAAFEVACPARQHAIKKLAMAGLRGKGDQLQDLYEARDAVIRAIQMQEQEMGIVQVPSKTYTVGDGTVEERKEPNGAWLVRPAHGPMGISVYWNGEGPNRNRIARVFEQEPGVAGQEKCNRLANDYAAYLNRRQIPPYDSMFIS